jgi:hypothetical protein
MLYFDPQSYKSTNAFNRFKQSEIKKIQAFLTQYYKLERRIRRIQILFRHKRIYKTYDFDTDMNMTPLSDFSPDQLITVVENNTIYKFTIPDMVKILYHSITNTSYMYISPKYPNNPFINIQFTDEHLYNLMIKMRLTKHSCNALVSSFFKHDMNLAEFKYYNYTALRDIAMDNYIAEGSVTELYTDLMEIMHFIRTSSIDTYYNFYLKIHLDPECNVMTKKRIVKLCKHIIKPYYIYVNAGDEYIKTTNLDKLVYFILKLQNNFPFFWREMYTVQHRTTTATVNLFDYNVVDTSNVALDNADDISGNNT